MRRLAEKVGFQSWLRFGSTRSEPEVAASVHAESLIRVIWKTQRVFSSTATRIFQSQDSVDATKTQASHGLAEHLRTRIIYYHITFCCCWPGPSLRRDQRCANGKEAFNNGCACYDACRMACGFTIWRTSE